MPLHLFHSRPDTLPKIPDLRLSLQIPTAQSEVPFDIEIWMCNKSIVASVDLGQTYKPSQKMVDNFEEDLMEEKVSSPLGCDVLIGPKRTTCRHRNKCILYHRLYRRWTVKLCLEASGFSTSSMNRSWAFWSSMNIYTWASTWLSKQHKGSLLG